MTVDLSIKTKTSMGRRRVDCSGFISEKRVGWRKRGRDQEEGKSVNREIRHIKEREECYV